MSARYPNNFGVMNKESRNKKIRDLQFKNFANSPPPDARAVRPYQKMVRQHRQGPAARRSAGPPMASRAGIPCLESEQISILAPGIM